MNTKTDNNIVKRSLYTLWAFITLILVFTLALLVIELAQSKSSSDGVEYTARNSEVTPIGNVPDVHAPDITLYFSHSDMVLLSQESRRIELSDSTLQNCRRAMEALIQGPIKHLIPVMPSSTRVRGMFLLENGELIIDFSRELEAGQIKSTATEWLMTQSIAHTMTQDTLVGSDGIQVQSVRFLFEGAPSQNSFPMHVDVNDPITPAASAISSVVESLGNA